MEVEPGQGRVYMFRGMNLSTVSNIDEGKFFAKVRSTAKGGWEQLAESPHKRRVLVLNIITPDAEFPMQWNAEIRRIVDEVSGGLAVCELLFFHKYVKPGFAAGVTLELGE